MLLACDATADHIALDAVQSLGLDVALVRNRAALMLIPAGITKGTGLREALAELGISPHNTIAVGDAENDHAMLAAAGLGVAVANAVDALRGVADLVLTLPDGTGVADLLGGPVLSGEQRIHAAHRRIVLGTTMAGEPVVVPSAQTNLLITGDSESGKSYLAGLVVEQLAAQGYTVLVVDPEGDHVPLGVLRAVTVISGEQLWPAVADQRAQTGTSVSRVTNRYPAAVSRSMMPGRAAASRVVRSSGLEPMCISTISPGRAAATTRSATNAVACGGVRPPRPCQPSESTVHRMAM